MLVLQTSPTGQIILVVVLQWGNIIFKFLFYITRSWLSLVNLFGGNFIQICNFPLMAFPFCDPDHFIHSFFFPPTDIYMSRVKADSGSMPGDLSRFPNANDNGFVGNLSSFGNQPLPKEESVSAEPSRLLDPRLEGSKKSMGSVSALKELVRSQRLEHLWF